MKRLLYFTIIILVAAIALPPLWFAILPAEPPPALPAAGKRIVLPGGVGVNILDVGEGPTVVLIHGLPGSGYEWRETQPFVAASGLRAIAYVRVGYGRSDPRTSNEYSTGVSSGGSEKEGGTRCVPAMLSIKCP